uniref:Serpin domain-containing protein n=1 Tax=Timema bartmani TaxID=61472 RepID=A0A7R9ERB0_9NEOP|nr:unnamed protein product [Timema bartmani]
MVASLSEEAESSEEEEEGGDTTQPTIKVSEVRDRLNYVIQHVEQSTNENVSEYYEHLQHLLMNILLLVVLARDCKADVLNGIHLVTTLSNSLVPKLFQGQSCSRQTPKLNVEALSPGRENLVFAPFGLASNVAMLLEGSDGNTAQEIYKALNIQPKTTDDLRLGFKAYFDSFESSAGDEEPAGSFNMAILRSSDVLSPSYKSVLTQYYRANITDTPVFDNRSVLRRGDQPMYPCAGIPPSAQVLELRSDSGVMSHWKDYHRLAAFAFLSHVASAPFRRSPSETVQVPMIPQVGVFRTGRVDHLKYVLPAGATILRSAILSTYYRQGQPSQVCITRQSYPGAVCTSFLMLSNSPLDKNCPEAVCTSFLVLSNSHLDKNCPGAMCTSFLVLSNSPLDKNCPRAVCTSFFVLSNSHLDKNCPGAVCTSFLVLSNSPLDKNCPGAVCTSFLVLSNSPLDKNCPGAVCSSFLVLSNYPLNKNCPGAVCTSFLVLSNYPLDKNCPGAVCTSLIVLSNSHLDKNCPGAMCILFLLLSNSHLDKNCPGAMCILFLLLSNSHLDKNCPGAMCILFLLLSRCEAVELPLEAEAVSLLLLVPDSSDHLDEMIVKLSDVSLQQLVSWLTPKETEVSLPQLAILSSSLDLTTFLRQLGVRAAFNSSSADLTKASLSGGGEAFKGVYAKSVMQDAYFSTSFVAVNSVGSVSVNAGLLFFKHKTEEGLTSVGTQTETSLLSGLAFQGTGFESLGSDVIVSAKATQTRNLFDPDRRPSRSCFSYFTETRSWRY